VDPVDIALFVVVALALGYVVAGRMGLSMDDLFAGIGKGGSGGVGETATRFVPVANVAALDPLLARSHGGPVVLFLHDKGCPISRAAYRQMARLGGEIPLVDVRRAHDVSRDVEERIGVRHESPQRGPRLRGGAAPGSDRVVRVALCHHDAGRHGRTAPGARGSLMRAPMMVLIAGLGHGCGGWTP